MKSVVVFDVPPEGKFERVAFEGLAETVMKLAEKRLGLTGRMMHVHHPNNSCYELSSGKSPIQNFEVIEGGVEIFYHRFGNWVQVGVRGEKERVDAVKTILYEEVSRN